MKKSLLITMLLFCAFIGHAQQNEQKADSLYDLSLEELLNVPISVASGKEQKQEEAPSIVSVITAKEIQAYGYRDLSDVLRTIPGVDFGIDVASNVGISFRGIWAHEGKCLLQINGAMMNDLGYGNFTHFGSIPASMIERVEVIRGPGSALYGGFAEVMVINVVTRQEKSDYLSKVSVSGGMMGNNGMVRGVNANFNITHKDGYVAGAVGTNTSFITTKTYTDFAGNQLPFDAAISARRYDHVIIEARIKNLTLNMLHTEFNYYGQDGFTTIPPKINGISTEKLKSYNNVMRASYEATVSDKLKIIPSFSYNQSSPIALPLIPSPNYYSAVNPSVETNRVNGELKGDLTLGKFNLVTALGYIRDMAFGTDPAGKAVFFAPNRNDFTTSRYTESKYFLMQGDFISGRFGVTTGFRFENTTFGNAFAPRLGITFITEKFNAKALYGYSYRIPTHMNAYYTAFTNKDTSLEPEKAHSYELELGYKITANLKARLNLFQMAIHKPIVYLSSNNSYNNFGDVVTRGVEAEIRYANTGFNAFANFSYYRPGSETSVDFLTNDANQFLGLSPVKITMGASKQWGNLNVAPSIVYLSKKSSANATLDDSYSVPAITWVNLALTYAVSETLDFNVTCHNLFDADYLLTQPYYGGHAPMPALNRNVMLKIIWTMK